MGKDRPLIRACFAWRIWISNRRGQSSHPKNRLLQWKSENQVYLQESSVHYSCRRKGMRGSSKFAKRWLKKNCSNDSSITGEKGQHWSAKKFSIDDKNGRDHIADCLKEEAIPFCCKITEPYAEGQRITQQRSKSNNNSEISRTEVKSFGWQALRKMIFNACKCIEMEWEIGVLTHAITAISAITLRGTHCSSSYSRGWHPWEEKRRTKYSVICG